jgi:hypothetical protein
LAQLGDTLKEITINVIEMFGWEDTFRICGLFGIVVGVLGILFVSEPIREEKYYKDMM